MVRERSPVRNRLLAPSRCSSVEERTPDKGEVGSSFLPTGTKCRMKDMEFFQVTMSGSCEDTYLLEEAENFISAYMSAQKKVDRINNAMQARWPKEWSQREFPVEITGIMQIDMTRLEDDEAIEKFVENAAIVPFAEED